MWKLKQTHHAFEMVDGPMTGRTFTHGIEYAEIPIRYSGSFELATPASPVAAAEPATPPAKKTKSDKEEVANA